jgi:hypothetical protein
MAVSINQNDGFVSITCTGGETDLAFDFPLFDEDHITVIRTRSGTETTLTVNTDYTIDPSDIGVAGGGDVVLSVAATAGDVYTLLLNVPEERSTDFNNAGDFKAETLNRELDLQTQMIQQLRRDVNKSASLPDTSTLTSLDFPAPEAGKVIAWNQTEDGLQNITVGNDVVITNLAEVSGTAPIIHLESTSSGATSLTHTNSQIRLTARTMNTTNKYTPMLAFGSDDADFVTTNPKLGAFIVGEATAAYSTDATSGMLLNFGTTVSGQTTPTLAPNMQLATEVLRPATNDGLALGSGTLSWKDLFLADGGVINWNNGNATLTHSAGLLTSSVGIDAPAITADKLTVPNAGTLTIASGAITVTGSRHAVDTEAAAASDDLDTINGGSDRLVLVLNTVSNSRDVTLKDGTGNLRLAGDCTLGTSNDRIVLEYVSSTATWVEVSRSINDGAAYGAKAVVRFDGTTNTDGFCDMQKALNVASVADNGTGDYTVTFTTAMTDANYAFQITAGSTSLAGNNIVRDIVSVAAGSIRFIVGNTSGNADMEYVTVTIFE